MTFELVKVWHLTFDFIFLLEFLENHDFLLWYTFGFSLVQLYIDLKWTQFLPKMFRWSFKEEVEKIFIVFWSVAQVIIFQISLENMSLARITHKTFG